MTPLSLLRTMPRTEWLGLWLFAWSAPVLALGIAAVMP